MIYPPCNTRIKDTRIRAHVKLTIKSLPSGTWFIAGLGLFLKCSQDVCVDMHTGCRAPFAEDCLVNPVEVEIMIVRDINP